MPRPAPDLPPSPATAPASSQRFHWSETTRCTVKTDLLDAQADTDPQSAAQGPQSAAQGLQGLRDLVRRGGALRVGANGVARIGARPLLLCETGGTGGAPKVIRRTQASWIASFEINRARFHLTPEDSFAVLGALSHSLALYGALEAAHIGADLHHLAGMGPRAQALALAAASVLYATPAQLTLLLRGGGAPLPGLRHLLCGGGALGAGLRAELAQRFPNAQITAFYGASETSFITMSDAQTPEGSVGKAYPGAQIKVAAPLGEIGEVWVKSPYLFEGYAEGMSAETRWDQGFLTVGELGHLDAQGHLFLHGRRRRMVRIAEQTVFPEEVEAAIAERAPGRSCAVIARPDAARGSVLVAVLSGPADAALAEAIRSDCRARLGALKAPKTVVFMAAFPVLASGKPNLAQIAHWLEEQR